MPTPEEKIQAARDANAALFARADALNAESATPIGPPRAELPGVPALPATPQMAKPTVEQEHLRKAKEALWLPEEELSSEERAQQAALRERDRILGSTPWNESQVSAYRAAKRIKVAVGDRTIPVITGRNGIIMLNLPEWERTLTARNTHR
jgi:hypothetical protein